MAEDTPRKLGRLRFPLRMQRISWRDLAASLGPVLILSAAAIWYAFHFVRPAPPNTLAIASGPEGSLLYRYAERYKKILARNGVTVRVVQSQGTIDNLKKLVDPAQSVDVGFVQGGVASLVEDNDLVSLGSVAYVPLIVFYRSEDPLDRLSELKGMRLAVGREGSGTHFLAMTLLKANGIEAKGATRLIEASGEDAVDALLRHKADAAFLAGESASPENLRKLIHAAGIRVFDFTQADAYVGRFRYLSKLTLPPGSFDLGRIVPEKPLTLVAPTVDLIARPDLHPALSDLLIEAAREVHGRATLIQRAGEFPAPLEHDFPISDDAARYYKSGKGFVYRFLPFWLASLADRTVLVLLPVIILLIPALRFVPTLYNWRIRTRIFRRYGELMALERAALAPSALEQRTELLKKLDEIENAVITLKMPASFADQLYVLRLHIKFVRDRLSEVGA